MRLMHDPGYAGDAESGGVEGIFVGTGPFRNFSTGGYDIDVESGIIDTDLTGLGTSFTVLEPSFTFDSSSWDNAWEDWSWQNTTLAFQVDTFDQWDYGNVFEPVILDLNGDGFDESTAWVGPGDGILVLNDPANDLASGVVVANRNEIAFSQTPGQTDLEALAIYDTNANGSIDAGDARWSDFRIWVDTNGDGYSDPDYPETSGVNENEVFTMAGLGIASVSLTRDNQSFLLPDGSLIHGFGTFTRTSGAVGATADVALAYDPVGQRAHRERLFGTAANQVGGVFFEGEDGKSFFIVDSGRSFSNNVSYLNQPNNFTVGATIPFAGGVVLNWGGITGGNLQDIITVSDTNATTGGKWLYGNGGNDIITGGVGTDRIDGGTGNDTLNGGGGDDTIYFDAAENTATALIGGAGHDTGVLVSTTAINIDLAARGLESLIANAGNDTITANAAVAATIDGRGGNDSITGGGLGDILTGGLGNDTVNAGSGGDLVLGGAGTDTLNGQDGDDALFGGDGADALNGGTGADKLDGGAGNDSLTGGAGDDVYLVDAAGDTVVEAAGEGTDRIETNLVVYTLATNAEHLSPTGPAEPAMIPTMCRRRSTPSPRRTRPRQAAPISYIQRSTILSAPMSNICSSTETRPRALATVSAI